MPMDFPSSPTVGQLSNGYVWDGTAWNSTAAQPISLTTVAAGDNYIINGAFDIWQRGTSLTTTANVYTADRWYGEGGNVTVSRQTTGVPPASTYCMRTAMTSTTFNNKYQIIESLNASALHDKTVTFQVKLRRNASFTGGLVLRLSKSSTVDAGMGATWVEIVGITVSNSSLPTGTGASNWYTASITGLVPNDGSANTLRVEVSQTVAEPSGAYWEMAEAQLEQGSAATAFRRNAPSIAGELAACQRYCYEPHGGYYLAASTFGDVMTAQSASTANGTISFPVTMRAKPSMTIASGSDQFRLGYPGSFVISGVTFNDASRQQAHLTVASSGLTTFTGYHFYLQNDRTVPQLIFSAEL